MTTSPAPYYTIGYHRLSDDSVTSSASYLTSDAVSRDAFEIAESDDIDQVWVRTWQPIEGDQPDCIAIDYVKGRRG